MIIVIFGLGSRVSHPSAVLSSAETANATVTLSSFFTAMLAAFWAYQGWVSVGFIGGEVKDARKNIPRGIIIGVILVIIIYLVVNFTYLSLLSVPQLEQIHSAGNQIAAIEAVRSFWGSYGVVLHLPAYPCYNTWMHKCKYPDRSQTLLCHGTGKIVFP